MEIVFPNCANWSKFNLKASGAIVAQKDMQSWSADVEIYYPNKKELVSKESLKKKIHHTTLDLAEYYILVTDGNISNSAFELVLDII